ncbi:MAG TPA: hypothetical protein VI548_09210 [Chitinophagaceae bacterium]|nr:hypothetical protein [Chitinophagaceae bacterium]
MLSENFDKKIKDLLEQENPVFEDAPWHNMQALLDRYMPQKKDNRRSLIIFLFLFMLLGGGTFLMMKDNKPGKENTTTSNHLTGTNNKTGNQPLNSTTAVNSENKIPLIMEKTNSISPSINFPLTKKRNILTGKKITEPAVNSKPSIPEINTSEKQPEDKFTQKTDQVNEISVISPNKIENNFNTRQEPAGTKETSQPALENLNENKQLPETNKATSKKKTSFLSNIRFNLSAGPDISSVGNNIGKVKMMLGTGLGYKISDRLSIRSGIFVGRKIYTTNPDDYNPPSNFWAYYPDLKSIDADCKVLEIPLLLDFHFGSLKKQNWFISAGASSLFMKKEAYNYYFKPTNSLQYVYYTRTYENKNKHYFSILNLSGGYTRKINPVLTLQAEPYMKIALEGVGYGKVKLNSAGLLLTASLQPFQSKK